MDSITPSTDPVEETVTFRLTLDVTYNPNGVHPADLRRMLERIATGAAGDGLMTGDTDATVESYDYLVQGHESRPSAPVAWTAEDIRSLAPRLSKEQAMEWLESNAHHIQNRVIELGWGVIGDLLAYDGVDTSDVEEDDAT